MILKFTSIALLLFSFNMAHAQSIIEVNEKTLQYSAGAENALTMLIPEADAKQVEKDWKKELSDWKGKMDEKKGEYFFDNCQLKELSTDYFDAYTTVTQEGVGVRVNLWINLGGAFMNSKDHAVQSNFFSSKMHDFGIAAAKEFVQEQLDDANKLMSDYKQKQNDLEKTQSDLKKQIADCEAAIKQANLDIDQNNKDQASNKDLQTNQQKVIDAIQTKLNGIK